jgi:nucleoid DNA-binding protein|tara:strand:+ start:4218 stop:4493 length:276 start_codon:yes stop_codon:yes gene_type:complete
MNFSKKNIVKNITIKTSLSSGQAKEALEYLLLLIKTKSKSRSVKISSFGTFSFKKTPRRLGRNPKTKDSYIISELNKLNFKPSNKIKEKIN